MKIKVRKPCPYFGQDERLENESAVVNAVDQATQWLLSRKWRNVLVEFNNEDDRPWRDKHQGFGEEGNNMIVSIENGVSWGYFDYREKGESIEQGFQNPPVDWGINSGRKKQFFGLPRKVTSH